MKDNTLRNDGISRVLFLTPARLALTAASLLAVTVCAGNVYHVSVGGSDERSGAQNAPFASIQHAIGRANPGDVIRVGPGVFHEQVIFRRRNSGTKDAPIILEGTLGANGEQLTNIDGGTPVNPQTWKPAPDIGPGVYQNASFEYEPRLLMVDGKFLGHVHRSKGKALEMLAWPEDHRVRTMYLKQDIPFWKTMGGIYAHHPDENRRITYLRLAGGADPRKHAVTIAPSGSVIAIHFASHIIVRNLKVTSGDTGISVSGSHNVIENCFVAHGRRRIRVVRAQDTTIRNCTLTMGFLGQSPGAWLGGGQSPDAARKEYIYNFFKYLHGRGETSDDCSIQATGTGINLLVESNTLASGLIGIQSASGMIVRNNTIKNHSSVGIVIADGVHDAHYYDNVLSDNSTNIRLHRVNRGNQAMSVSIYRNRMRLPKDTGWHVNTHAIWRRGDYPAPQVWFYHNTLSGGSLGFDLPPHTNMPQGVPEFRFLNNVFDANRSIRSTQLLDADAVGLFAYNWLGGRMPSPRPAWLGENNIVAEGEHIWEDAGVFRLPVGHPARNAGIDVSRPFTIDGVTYDPLPGMKPGYSRGARPDLGAVQND